MTSNSRPKKRGYAALREQINAAEQAGLIVEIKVFPATPNNSTRQKPAIQANPGTASNGDQDD